MSTAGIAKHNRHGVMEQSQLQKRSLSSLVLFSPWDAIVRNSHPSSVPFLFSLAAPRLTPSQKGPSQPAPGGHTSPHKEASLKPACKPLAKGKPTQMTATQTCDRRKPGTKTEKLHLTSCASSSIDSLNIRIASSPAPVAIKLLTLQAETLRTLSFCRQKRSSLISNSCIPVRLTPMQEENWQKRTMPYCTSSVLASTSRLRTQSSHEARKRCARVSCIDQTGLRGFSA